MSIATVKMHWNSIISTDNRWYIIIDIIDFYLNSNLKEYEYVYIELELIPQDFIDQYNLKAIAKDGKVLAEVRKVMYRLKQAGKLAHKDFKKYLALHSYHPTKFILGL